MDLSGNEVLKHETFSFEYNSELFKKCNMTESCLKGYDLESDWTIFRFITLGIILGGIEILGVIGNTLSIIVLSRAQMRSGINYLLLALSVFDTIVIFNSFMILTLGSLFPYTSYFVTYNLSFLPYFTLLFQPLMASTYMISVYLIIAVTLERYVAVCHPLKAKAFCSTSMSKKCIYGIICFAVLYHMPMYWETIITTVEHTECGLTIKCLGETEMGKNALFITIYWEYMHSIFITLIPFLSLAYFNICIFKEVKRVNVCRDEMCATERNEIDLAKMLLRLVAVFFVCNIVFPSLHICRYIVKKDISLEVWSIVKDFGQFLVIINSCVNFVLYIISGTKFREVFIEVFGKSDKSNSKNKLDSKTEQINNINVD